MKLAEYQKTLNQPLRQATLCFLIQGDKILLAMKKRGFGKGRWNGVGGKPSLKETVEEAVMRETSEEIGVCPLSLKRVATLNFYFLNIPKDKDWNQQVCVFLANKWEGEPTETEEMAPRWFETRNLPFDSMWADDPHWLPKVLKGCLLKAEFLFDENERLLEFEVIEGSY